MDITDLSETAISREAMVESTSRSASPTEYSPSTPRLSNGDAVNGDSDLWRAIQRDEDGREQLPPPLYGLEDTDRNTDDPFTDSEGVRPEGLLPALYLFHHDIHSAPRNVQHACDFPPTINAWLSLNLFTYAWLGYSLSYLLDEYEKYTESTVHWLAVLEIGKSLLVDAYICFEHRDVDWDVEPSLSDLEDGYRGPSRTQAEFGSRVYLWEFKVQIWHAVLEFAERAGNSQEVRNCQNELMWEELYGIFRPWKEENSTSMFTSDTPLEHMLPLSRSYDWANVRD